MLLTANARNVRLLYFRSYYVSVRGKWSKDGFRSCELSGQPFTRSHLEKRGNLIFEAKTNVPKPFVVHWQVVNTGEEVARSGCLRGEFNNGEANSFGLVRKEETRYSGMHRVECFIEKNGVCVAKSSEFAINNSITHLRPSSSLGKNLREHDVAASF
jgi:hypothetical protein